MSAETVALGRGDGRLRRRRALDRLMSGSATAAALVAVAVLGLVVASVLAKGAGALSWSFLTQSPALFGQPGGGIAPAIVGTVVLVALATAIALPLGVLTAIYLTEFAPGWIARPVRLSLDLLNGLPSIVVGMFVFGILVVGHQQSGFAGSVALAIVMLPLVARATQEVLLLVPRRLREAALALGVSRWRTVVGVVLPNALGGIFTGTVLAVARAAGETAPLLFTTSIFANAVSTDVSHALPNIPVTIFTLSESPSPTDHQRAWAAAIVLMAFVLLTSLAARAVIAHQRRRTSR